MENLWEIKSNFRARTEHTASILIEERSTAHATRQEPRTRELSLRGKGPKKQYHWPMLMHRDISCPRQFHRTINSSWRPDLIKIQRGTSLINVPRSSQTKKRGDRRGCVDLELFTGWCVTVPTATTMEKLSKLFLRFVPRIRSNPHLRIAISRLEM